MPVAMPVAMMCPTRGDIVPLSFSHNMHRTTPLGKSALKQNLNTCSDTSLVVTQATDNKAVHTACLLLGKCKLFLRLWSTWLLRGMTTSHLVVSCGVIKPCITQNNQSGLILHFVLHLVLLSSYLVVVLYPCLREFGQNVQPFIPHLPFFSLFFL